MAGVRGGEEILTTPSWGEIALLLGAAAALVVAGAVLYVALRLGAALREWSRLARDVGEAVAGVRGAAAGVEEAARGVKGAAEAVERVAAVAERRLEQLATGLDSMNKAAAQVDKATESLRFTLSVVEKTALPVLIRIVGWRAGLAEGLAHLLSRKGRRQRSG